MVIDIGTDEDIIKEKDIFGKRERDIEIVVKEIDGDRDRRAQSATNLLLPVQPLPRPYLISVQHLPNYCSSTLPDPQLLYFV